LQLDAAQHLFGVSSMQQAAALMQMDDKGMSGLSHALKSANVRLDDVNPESMRTLGAIGSATSMADLRKIYDGDLAQRTGPNALTDDEKNNLGQLEGSGNVDGFRAALIRAAAAHGQSDNDGTVLRQSEASLSNIQTLIGDKLVPYTNDVRMALLKLAGKDGKMASLDDLRKEFAASNGDATDDPIAATSWTQPYTGDKPRGIFDHLRSWVYQQGNEGQRMKLIAAEEQKEHLPPGLIKGVFGAESSFGKNTKRNEETTAEGDFQFTDDTAKKWGVDRNDFTSEVDGAGRYLRYLIDKHHGDVKAALFDWNGVKKNIATGEAFVRNVSSFGNTPIDGNYVMGAPVVPFDDAEAKKKATSDAQIKADDGMRVPSVPSHLRLDDGAAKLDDQKIGIVDFDDDKGRSKLPATARPNTPSTTETVERQSDGTQMVVLDIGVNVNSNNGAGSKTVSTASTVVGVPRGSGTRRISVTAE
jgi:hypothetical protein